MASLLRRNGNVRSRSESSAVSEVGLLIRSEFLSAYVEMCFSPCGLKPFRKFRGGTYVECQVVFGVRTYVTGPITETKGVTIKRRGRSGMRSRTVRILQASGVTTSPFWWNYTQRIPSYLLKKKISQVPSTVYLNNFYIHFSTSPHVDNPRGETCVR